MKRIIILFALGIATMSVYAQKNSVEVLYFKAQLTCCKAASCNNLEGEVKSIIEKNFAGKAVTFKQVPLADEANKALVEKYNAKSQTVVLVVTKKKTETSVDVSDIVRRYARSDDKAAFEKELTAKINEALK
ncbi:MAG: hypothetical protein FWC39_13610 [Bacteroidetes bacterium]|nr:hypothetical protein [Bacteroidota bacterium]